MKIIDVKSELDYGEVQLVAVYEDGSEEFLFGYFPEEYSISPSELIGKTKDEAFDVKYEKDLAFMRS